VEYLYDGEDNRIAKVTSGGTTTYLIDSNTPYAQVITESQANGTEVHYTYGNDLVGDGTHYFLTDALGSTRGLVDSNEALTDSYDYKPYGELAIHTGSSTNSFLFTGEQFDAKTNNYYLRARYYSPSLTRFLSRDTYDGRDYEPITLNHYLYANANPVIYVDPSGHFFSMSGMSMSITTMGILGGLTGGGLNIWHQTHQTASGNYSFSIKGFIVWTISGAATGATMAYGGWYALLRFGPQITITVGTTATAVGRKIVQRWPSINILKNHFIKHGNEINSILLLHQ
jgi:RHS repeat-associated protein